MFFSTFVMFLFYSWNWYLVLCSRLHSLPSVVVVAVFFSCYLNYIICLSFVFKLWQLIMNRVIIYIKTASWYKLTKYIRWEDKSYNLFYLFIKLISYPYAVDSLPVYVLDYRIFLSNMSTQRSTSSCFFHYFVKAFYIICITHVYIKQNRTNLIRSNSK